MYFNRNQLLYISHHEEGSGVSKKIEGLCHSADRIGIKAELYNYTTIYDALKKMYSTKARYIIIRSITYKNLLFFIHLFLLRIKGKILILDQPSPLTTYIKEVRNQKRPWHRKLLKIILTYLNGPWGQWPYQRVLQYAEESAYFLIGNHKKTLIVGNGIDIERIKLREHLYPDPCDEIRLIGVANNISNWHGFDRIVRAMIMWKKKGLKPHISFDIVGNATGIYIEQIKKMAIDGGIGTDVKLLGFLNSEDLNNLYSKETLAVGSLGLYRNNLYTSSILKIREYCLAGIPFIACGNDPDFPNTLPFRLEIPNDNSIEKILDIFEVFCETRKHFSDYEIHEYAVNNLSFEKKIIDILNGFL